MNKATKFKKWTLFIVAACILIVTLSFSAGVSALRIGDEIGDVLNTDIRTFINGERIPSYNINGRSIVLIKDLINYGFDSFFDNNARTSTIRLSPGKRFTPLSAFDEQLGRPGTVAFRHLHTDIRAIINGVPVDSYNIRGNLAIVFTDLRDVGNFGAIHWNPVTRESRMTLVVPVTGISLDRTSASVREGDAVSLTAAVTPANATNRNVTWSSSNVNTARVDNNGRVTGVRAGTATITATAPNGMTATSAITVTSAVIPVNTVTFDRTNATVRTGEHILLHAAIAPTNATDRTLTWASSDDNIARVDNNGRVTGVRAGTATITATAPNGRFARATIRVENLVQVNSVRIDPPNATIPIGETRDLTATVLPSNATDRSVTWSSNNPHVAQVNQNGRVTAVNEGTATITATTHNGRTHTAAITVTRPGIFPNLLNTERGPFTIGSPSIPEVAFMQIQSFRFTRADETSSHNTVQLEMRIRGTSSHDHIQFVIRFVDGNNNFFDMWVSNASSITANQAFDITETRAINRDVLSRTVRIEFRSVTGQLAVPGVGGSGPYWTGESVYRRTPSVPDFGTVASGRVGTAVWANMTIISDTLTSYTYDFTNIANATVSSIIADYRSALQNRGFWLSNQGPNFITYISGSTIVNVWWSGNSVTVQVQTGS